MTRRDARARSANIERLGQFNEFHAGSIRSAKENRDLEANPRRTAPLRLIQVLPFLKTFDSHSVGPIVLAI